MKRLGRGCSSASGGRIARARHAEPGSACLGAVVLACPENVTVAAADHAEHTPGVVIVDRRWGFGWKTAKHQGRATVAAPQNAEAGAGTVQGGKPGRIDEIRIGSELAEQRTDTGERRIARAVLGQQVLGRAEELLETRRWRHEAIIRQLLVRAGPGSGRASESRGALPPAAQPSFQGTGRCWRAGD